MHTVKVQLTLAEERPNQTRTSYRCLSIKEDNIKPTKYMTSCLVDIKT